MRYIRVCDGNVGGFHEVGVEMPLLDLKAEQKLVVAKKFNRRRSEPRMEHEVLRGTR